MKKRCYNVFMAVILGACVLTGCQETPQVSADQDVLHARSALESEVDAIAADSAGTNGAEQSGTYDAVVGTEENGIWICAEIPAVPQTIPQLTLRERDDWDGELLKALLDSESGRVEDVTAEYLAQREKELSEMDEEDIPSEWPRFGDDSLLMFSDGQKEASFARNSCASYDDKALKEECTAIYKTAPEIDVTENGECDSAKFSVSHAEAVLLEKLAVLNIEEISIFQVYYYELGATAFYELRFTPSYEKVGVASEFGSISIGEVHPDGMAWVTENGVAMLRLEDFCGRITEQSEEGTVLTFSQVTDILGKYLENNTLCGVSQAKLTHAELVYYPVFRDPDLILTPVWHIYTPLKQGLESAESGDAAWNAVFEKAAATNIYLDAVTGKLIEAE